MIFANIFEIKINFYETADFFEKDKVKSSKITSYLPLLSNDSNKKSLNILLDEKKENSIRTLLKNDIKLTKKIDKREKKQSFENQQMHNLLGKIKLENINYRKENFIFRRAFENSLLITNQFLSDLNDNKRKKDIVTAYKKIRSYRRNYPEFFT